jgi:hypothetical protein
MPQPPDSYVYVLIRKDIKHPHQSVQIGHAVLAATNAFGQPYQRHPNLIVCAVDDEATLAAEFNRLKEQGVPCCAWYEEDFGNALTAVATGLLQGKARRPLAKYKLLC